MAVLVLKDAFVSIDGTELSDHCRQVTFAYSAEGQDKTAMTNATRAMTGGLLAWSMDFEFLQDYDNGSVEDTLWPLVGSSTFTVIIRPTTAAAGSSNTQYSGTGFLESFNPVAGGVGDMAVTPVRILSAGDITRSTN